MIDRVVGGRHEPLEFFVRATPINIEDTELTVVTLVDIADKKRAEAVERMFIHDLLNCVQGLKGLCEMASMDLNDIKLEEMEQIQDLADYLSEMANAHRDLTLMENGEFECAFKEAAIKDVLSKVKKIVTFAGVARYKTLVVDGMIPDIRLTTDEVLLVRVLVNMVKNALEATEPGGAATLCCEVLDGRLRLSVWNGGQIPEQTALRVFQRYFSTKPGNGRGLGTYSMRLIAEQYLQGQVSFQTSEAGTTFTVSLPL